MQDINRCALVVEDELLVAMVASDALAELGFRAIEAPSAAKALELAEENKSDIVLALVDLGLPDMTPDAMDVGTKTVSTPFRGSGSGGMSGMSTTLMRNSWRGAPTGHGSPGPPACGGLPPVGLGGPGPTGGRVVPGSGRRSSERFSSTRMIPQAPCRSSRQSTRLRGSAYSSH